MSQRTTDTDSETNRPLDAIATRRRWEAIVDRVKACVEECILTIDAEGLHTRAEDAAKVCLVDLTLSPEGFESYEGTQDEIGLSLDRFEDVLSLADAEDLVRVALDAKTRKFHVAGDGFEYSLAGIDPDSIRARPDIPDLDLPVVASIGGDKLSHAVGGCNMVGDHVEVGNDADTAEIYAAADGDTDDVRFAWSHDDLEGFEAGGGETVESFYSTGYLAEVAAAIDDDPVTVHLGEEFPVRMIQPFADDAGDCEFFLAPRIRSR